jgi:hypothetical protein
MHGVHDVKFGQAGMSDFPLDQLLRDNADHLAAGRKRRVRDHAHQAKMPTTVNQADAALGEQRAEATGGLLIFRPATRAGTGIDTDAHASLFSSSSPRKRGSRCL